MKAENFFTQQEQQAIADTVEAVERKTSGEVAVMLVDASDDYPESPLLAGMVLGGASSLAVTDLFFHDSLWIFIPLTMILALLFGWLTNRLAWLKRVFIPKARIDGEVEQRAVQAFYEKGLYKTRDATGVLFFISLLEHKAWVLADAGIYSKISPETLQEYAGHVAQGIKEGRAAEALCAEIGRVGTILSLHFPIRDDDSNELDNRVMVN